MDNVVNEGLDALFACPEDKHGVGVGVTEAFAKVSKKASRKLKAAEDLLLQRCLRRPGWQEADEEIAPPGRADFGLAGRWPRLLCIEIAADRAA